MTTENQVAEVDYSVLGIQLEEQEIDSPGGVASPQVYGPLLAIYILQNDTANAKFLWKRIPPAVKSANPELGHLWGVGQKLWARDFPGIYQTANREWPDHLKPIMTTIVESVRQRALNLVARAYSSIGTEDLSSFVGLPINDAVAAVVAEGWLSDPQSKTVTPPKLPEKQGTSVIASEQQLGRLTEFVSFLEN
eukprot:GHVU01033681.1.p1 GENE.GHVU01033681.1~~GHVU01033681.1.p1  ORF type:complete len:193 (+),score=24.41 GHVU01033681.1:51-629(+)